MVSVDLEVPSQEDVEDTTATTPRRTHVDSGPFPTDSMVTVPLSSAHQSVQEGETVIEATTPKPEISIQTNLPSRPTSFRPSSLDILHGLETEDEGEETTSAGVYEEPNTVEEHQEESPAKERSESDRARSNSSGSEGSGLVDWERLDKTEAQEPREEGSDDQIALLLARLDQENEAIANDTKSGAITVRERSQSRPPSMYQLQRIANNRASQAVRLSQLPEPPPMTELEFWAALVKDYPQTAQRLPTLTSNKIKAGIPAPLRGVVWVSMAGARDKTIEDQYDRLCGESSPYEGIIGKDIGRSFPGVEMFRNPEGEGQKMLGRVLKCFSLYDTKIGYCQGLGFLVGPLLMQMGEREAFCVLVRLMEDYDLRSCFLPDLSGLHLRIFQFQKLLKQHLPELDAHLASLQVEAAYLSQWFLSFFAVTCPLPMLFRIYDTVFAEGASETIMRVALSVMRKNQKKLMAMHEFEDVMQVLLSRALWDPYGFNARSADDLVNDFCSFTSLVTRESLRALEASFKEAQNDESAPKASYYFPDVQAAASRFLGRLWSPANAKSTSLSPGGALAAPSPSRPSSFLRRTPSKQSLASTMNSTDVGSDSIASISTGMTEITALSRDSSANSLKSIKSPTDSTGASVRITVSSKDRSLHGQIEDLLTALSEMQRKHTVLAAQLQKEREERNEDHKLVSSLLDRLRDEKEAGLKRDNRRRTTHGIVRFASDLSGSITPPTPIDEDEQELAEEDIGALISRLHSRVAFSKINHRSSNSEPRAVLRADLDRTKEALQSEYSRSASLAEELATSEQDRLALRSRFESQEQENSNLRDQLKDARGRVQDMHKSSQRMEKTIQDLRQQQRKNSAISSDSLANGEQTPKLERSDSTGSASGLRELRLGRKASFKTMHQQQQHSQQSPTSTSTAPKRTSSLAAAAWGVGEVQQPSQQASPQDDSLLLDLVNAKTAEAVARQELEEMKSKFEALRKAMAGGMSSPGAVGAGMGGNGHKPSPSEGYIPSFIGGKGGGALRREEALRTPSPATSVAGSGATGGGGGFWGWGKRSVS
ncbi:hypothetical protein K402DRAFT_394129 [Aulographum hederae CBS 113979]|uniref:Rab-GAP TBC domain-containing protein n=1 Tax=Aulographum hederae CBS 113979 TaxID=1176131 RepID=A0A6G1GZS1_9PEZI|nr:hypothetical protein K402DRAFT_394129 [Aulographum hederae CBS 113979]